MILLGLAVAALVGATVVGPDSITVLVLCFKQSPTLVVSAALVFSVAIRPFAAGQALRLLNDEPMRRKMGDWAAKSAWRRFDLECQVDDYLEWYRDLVVGAGTTLGERTPNVKINSRRR